MILRSLGQIIHYLSLIFVNNLALKTKDLNIRLTMKKSYSNNGTKLSQKKISVYFTKGISNSSTMNSTIEINAVNRETPRKRKISKDTDLTRVKIAKCDNISDACSIKSIHQTPRKQRLAIGNKDNVIDIFNSSGKNNDTDMVINETISEDIFITEYDWKENIGTNEYISTTCKSNKKQIMEKKALLQEIQPDNHLIKENKTDHMKQSVFGDKKREGIHSEIESFFTDDFKDCFEEEWCLNTSQINFNSLQRCKIIDVQREYNSILLTVNQEDCGTSDTTVRCSGFWKDAKVQKDDIVVIQARKENNQWIIDNSSGFLIVQPDALISGTTVSGALFCKRKAVLSEKFRKMESLPPFMGDSTPLVIGSLVHELLQTAIRKNISEVSDITMLMNSILQTTDTCSLLYASKISLETCRQQILPYVPKIREFIQHYLKDKTQQGINNIKNNFKGRIAQIRDIEENIWLPKLGLKGKIDISAEVKVNCKQKIMPLEIKTGKPSFSLEHRAQVILYIMMMSLTGQDTDTGLLLYLRENNIQEINSSHPEKRDLILLRNSLASYFVPKSSEKLSNLTSKSDLQMLDLPEPINHHNACSKCTYNTLCCMYLSKDSSIQLSETNPLVELGKKILDKYKPSHIDYVLHWISLLQMEESSQSSNNVTRYLWTLSPEKREAKKTCICNLKVIGKVTDCDTKYRHTFVRSNLDTQFSNINIPYMEFSDNEYVLVSTNTRINLSAGFIAQRKEDSITLILERDVTKYNINEFFHIDKYSSSSLFSGNLANVGGLMSDSEICEKLRDIVIDKKPACFEKGLPYPIIKASARILQNLNKIQQRAVLMAISAKEYLLIKGMPGTGKTQTLVALVEVLHKLGHSVLITSHTNSAVDNILLKLLHKDIDFLRLGSSTHPSLRHKSEAYATANCNTPSSLEMVYSSKNIIGVTCYGAHHALLGRRTFDVCIVDESTQVLQPTVLRPLYSAKKFILVGDPDQLPPIIKNKLARKLGADESLFARLDSENNTIKLTKQYRMNKSIMYLANKLTYNDMLEAGDTSIENATFVTPSKEVNVLTKEEEWIQKALSSDISDSIIVLNTGCTNKLKENYNLSEKGYLDSDEVNSNIWEAVIVSKLVKTFLKVNAKLENIGIIAPFRAHVSLLKKVVAEDIEINTVDQYQGRDKEIIIYSCAKSITNFSDIREDLEVLGDHRRLTVAITRAKHKLIVVADKRTISQYSAFKKLFYLIENKNIIDLDNSYNGFCWKNLLRIL
ncbi:DNA replication ATP-dependent helicase/nuclease DNA2 isoform X3 [Bombus huntii]|uniref:DNA replication ATP-dependent helicase/nuclease DNA2 isoform X3 n=1 Tax=Bombus huntii TaxID=85661 RepID=UPI0021AA1FA4|nr:DNA replication ATP-dependent helicase/nuclease DNA2 isoform X3 [Bombus huntii]